VQVFLLYNGVKEGCARITVPYLLMKGRSPGHSSRLLGSHRLHSSLISLLNALATSI
jgi:hypothetical protein